MGVLDKTAKKKTKKKPEVENFAAAKPFCILLSSNEVQHGLQGIGLL